MSRGDRATAASTTDRCAQARAPGAVSLPPERRPSQGHPGPGHPPSERTRPATPAPAVLSPFRCHGLGRATGPEPGSAPTPCAIHRPGRAAGPRKAGRGPGTVLPSLASCWQSREPFHRVLDEEPRARGRSSEQREPLYDRPQGSSRPVVGTSCRRHHRARTNGPPPIGDRTFHVEHTGRPTASEQGTLCWNAGTSGEALRTRLALEEDSVTEVLSPHAGVGHAELRQFLWRPSGRPLARRGSALRRFRYDEAPTYYEERRPTLRRDRRASEGASDTTANRPRKRSSCPATSARDASALTRPSTRQSLITWRRNATRRSEPSSSVISTAGQSSASAIPGRPPPEPRSSTGEDGAVPPVARPRQTRPRQNPERAGIGSRGPSDRGAPDVGPPPVRHAAPGSRRAAEPAS